MNRKKHTISEHDPKDNQCESPLEHDAKDDQSDEDINESRDDIEKKQLKGNQDL